MHPSLVLAAYAEGLLSGARVAYFGDTSLPTVLEIAARGARVVHAFDPDAARVAEATARGVKRGLHYAKLDDFDDLGVRDGAFDVALVSDLSLFGRDPGPLLALLRRALAPQGIAIVASANVNAPPSPVAPRPLSLPLGYYELYEALSAHFKTVRMLGQTPFIAYTVAELAAEGDPEPTIDTSLSSTGAQEPDWFVVLAAERPVRLDPYALVELPREAWGITPEPGGERARDAQKVAESERGRADEALRELSKASQDLVAAKDELTAKGNDLANLRRELTVASKDLVGARSDLEAASRELAQSQRERKASAEDLAKSNRGLEARAGDLAKSRVELKATGDELVRARTDLASSLDEGKSLRQRIAELEHEHAVATARATAAAAAATSTIPTPPPTSPAIEEEQGEVARLENTLRERGHRLMQAEAEIRRREEIVRDLLARLVENGAPVGLMQQMDRMAVDAARREADLASAGWRIAELEEKVSDR